MVLGVGQTVQQLKHPGQSQSIHRQKDRQGSEVSTTVADIVARPIHGLSALMPNQGV